MKGNKKILVAALLLLLISVSFGTYAIYRSTATATGTLTPARWSVKLGQNDFESANFTFTAADLTCTTNPGKAGTIAPGANCYINIPVDASGSQVDVILTATLGNVTLPAGWTVGLETGADSQTIEYNATSMTANVKVNVAWAGAESDDATKDGTDKAQGINPTALTIPVTLTAKQSLS